MTSTADTAAELPTPPLRLRRVMLHGIGPAGARFDPLDLNFEVDGDAASRVLLLLTNTGGKSTIITLLTHLILPAANEQIGGRQVGDFLLTGDTGHVVAEWEDASTGTSFITGMVMEWRDGGRQPPDDQRGAAAMRKRWYTFRTGNTLPGIDDLPFITGDRRTPCEQFVDFLRERFAEQPAMRGTVAHLQNEWAAALDELTSLDPVLFRYQMRMNDSEAGAEALLATFDTPENVVRFFVDAFAHDDDTKVFTGQLTEYAKRAAERPTLEAIRDFCDEASPLLGVAIARSAANETARTNLLRSEIEGSEHAAALNSRMAADQVRLAELAPELAELTARVAELRTEEGRIPDMRLQLRLIKARHDAQAAKAARDAAADIAIEAAAAAAGWATLDDHLRHEVAHEDWKAKKAAWEASEEGLAPLRSATDAAAQAYAARLDALAIEAEHAATTADSAAAAAEDEYNRAQVAKDAAQTVASNAASRLSEITSIRATATTALKDAAVAGYINQGEHLDRATARWELTRATAADDVERHRATAAAADIEHDQLQDQRRPLEANLAELRATATTATNRAAAHTAELSALAENPTILELLGEAPPRDTDDIRRVAELATSAGIDADTRAAAHQRTLDEAAAELEHLEATGTSPTGPDARAVRDTLIAAGIGASTGLAWVEANVAAATRAEFIETNAALCAGVIVSDPVRFDAAVAALNAEQLSLRTPVTVACPPDTDIRPDAAARHVVLPHRATWDREWAATMLAELADTVAREDTAVTASRTAAAAHRAAAAEATAFLGRWGDTNTAELETARTAAAAAASEAADQLDQLDQHTVALRGTAAAEREAAEAAAQQVTAADGAVQHLAAVAAAQQAATDAAAEVPALEEVERVERAAAETAAAAMNGARSAETAAAVAASRHRTERSQFTQRRSTVPGPSATTDPGGNVDVLADAWTSLRGQLAAATTGSVEAEAFSRAAQERDAAAKRLAQHPDSARARAAELAGLLDAADPDARLRSLTAARTTEATATAELARAEGALSQASADLRRAEPSAESNRANFVDLAGTPWEPPTPDDIPRLVAELDVHLDSLRTLRQTADGELGELTELRTAISNDVAAMEATQRLWRPRPDSPPAPTNVEAFTGSSDTALEEMHRLNEARDLADNEVNAAGDALREALSELRQAAADARWSEHGIIFAVRIRQLRDAELLAEADLMATRMAGLRASADGDLQGADISRGLLRDSLMSLCRTHRRLLRLVTSASELPSGLGNVSGQPAIRIEFKPAPEDEAAAALAARIDTWSLELAANPRRASSAEVRSRWLSDALGDTVINRPRAGRYTVEVLKPRIDGEVMYCPPRRIPKEFSGGQVLTLAVLVFCALSKVRAQSRTGGARPPGTLILDNPFGAASAETLVAMQHRLAAQTGVQLVCATGIRDPGVEAAFTTPGSVVVRLRNDGDVRRNMAYLRVRTPVADGIDVTAAITAGRPSDDPASYVDAISYKART